jgi:hypothetical protein
LQRYRTHFALPRSIFFFFSFIIYSLKPFSDFLHATTPSETVHKAIPHVYVDVECLVNVNVCHRDGVVLGCLALVLGAGILLDLVLGLGLHVMQLFLVSVLDV